ncbi:MAG: hypothetical protein OEZ59_10330 [Deltaproteobacteria bacterium]|nr:hypothetical protein [Deltaproteobacteria bacterium]
MKGIAGKKSVLAQAARAVGLLPALWVILLPVTAGSSDFRAVGEGVYPFLAYRLEEKEPAYKGEIQVKRQGQLSIDRHIYRTPDGTTVLEVESVFDLSVQRPVSFMSRDYRHGYIVKAGLSEESFDYKVFKGEELLDEGQSAFPAATFLWPNLMHVIANNWDPLGKGEQMLIHLFVFSRKDSFDFELRKIGHEEHQGKPVTRMELAPSSMILKLIVDPAQMLFDSTGSFRMLEYVGRGAVYSEEGHAENLRIVLAGS